LFRACFSTTDNRREDYEGCPGEGVEQIWSLPSHTSAAYPKEQFAGGLPAGKSFPQAEVSQDER
jgi:hypothetical protein